MSYQAFYSACPLPRAPSPCQDYYAELGAARPNFRWLVLGPARAGASWHVDPALTSAWNALLSCVCVCVCCGVGAGPRGAAASSPVVCVLMDSTYTHTHIYTYTHIQIYTYTHTRVYLSVLLCVRVCVFRSHSLGSVSPPHVAPPLECLWTMVRRRTPAMTV
ncbi:hypothetical protein Vafri_15582 [Volvox africanus]|uniref:JmjC domain-containing protein n=1 Tax=Volvox africanus TaxID=51714 RepID=A0A8J4BGL8_9CHLO|nr:hypothetical protein Vafri_15582 [Volvox africanus]